MVIQDIFDKYRKELDHLDLELIISHVLKKTREFVLIHPEYKISAARNLQIAKIIKRRLKNDPMAYILGQKEFFGLNFKVNKHTLIPRPETELLIEKVINLNPKNKTIIDIGAGSGNIIVALAKNIKEKNNFYGLDISGEALKIAKQNAKLHKVDKKIKFIKSNLLKYFFDHCSLLTDHCIILANLPYLSEKIYNSIMPDVKNYEPRSALLSGKDGLDHYRKLLLQIKKMKEKCSIFYASCFMEISPEQKSKIAKLIKSVFPKAKITFYKDLSHKWRICEIKI